MLAIYMSCTMLMICDPAISGGNLKGLSPEIGSLRILDTTPSTLSFEAKINITNPTEYSAVVPYVNIKLLSNDSEIGHATARNVTVVPGKNHDILVEALWDPKSPRGRAQGSELLSQYISGRFLSPLIPYSRLPFI